MNVMNFATRDVLTIGQFEMIDQAISLMEDRGIHHLVVTESNRAVGMVSDRDILISTGWMLDIERQVFPYAIRPTIVGPTHVVQIMSRPVTSLDPTSSVIDAAMLMLICKIAAIPIVANDRIEGIITESDLIRALVHLSESSGPIRKLLQMEVRDVMSTPAIIISPESPIADAVSLFRLNGIRHAPVTEGDVLRGIVSDRDVRRAVGWLSMNDARAKVEGKRPPVQLPNRVKDIMHTEVNTIDEGSQCADALNDMFEFRVHSLPVLGEGKLRGMMTYTDLLRAIKLKELL